MPFILDEDDALKRKLQNFSVENFASQSQVPIKVFYRFPDSEEITRSFPHISIDLVEINFDPSRAHRASEYLFAFDTELATPASGFVQRAYDYPLPFSLVYQLACYSRNPRHDRQMASMLFQLFPEGYGFLDMSNYDGTIRRADFVSSVRRDMVDKDNKRLYRNIFSVAISSEFFLGQIQEIQKTSQGIVLTLDVTVNDVSL